MSMHRPREWERQGALSSGHAREGSFYFSSPQRTLSSADAGTRLQFTRREDVVSEVQRALAFRERRSQDGIVAGALAFAGARLPCLRLHGLQDQRTRESARPSSVFTNLTPRKIFPQPSADDYRMAVARAVSRIRSGDLRKVVLSRALDLELSEPLDIAELLSRLGRQNPGKYIFRCELSDSEPRVLIGASPELLVAKHGIEVVSHPLAGSLPRSDDASKDGERAARLLDSAKNLGEHALVVEAVGDTLAPYCRELSVPRHPSLVQTATMWHLGTKVTGKLRDPQLSSLALAQALHPTPAVCGVPEARAAAAIEELEGFEREYFAGAVGYCDARGDGEWAVTIRCAEVSGHMLRLYAGAGIVADSTPDDELAETTAKLQTMLRALGIEQLPEDA
jgi:isochorismate synthase